MRTRRSWIPWMLGGALLIGFQTAPTPVTEAAHVKTVRNLTITGEIAKGANAYIIRGNAPAEIFTILNPNPGVLDKLVASGTVVKIEVRIVSGDNVEIQTIDGERYVNRSP